MKMSGTRQLPAPREQVWEKLNDIDVLRRCIPGCQSLEQAGDDQLTAKVGLKIGPIDATFNGEVQLSDMDPPNSYRISGSGKGGPAGSATGSANVTLTEKDDGTELAYDVDARVVGKIAQLGARLIDATAASLAGKFFDNFAAEFTTPEAESADVDSKAAAMSAPTSAVASSNDGRSTYLWWVIFGVAVLGILISFS